ncbi:helix-turn-helix domain-containing protein [Falsibacillus pallidus]|uniref:helix-turn-helix domain-containing protein n=1 Tax=Falsibacillus pallidus TaxID=493781 RepID=UPI003D97D767
MSFHIRLREYRENILQISQMEAAARLNLTPTSYSRYESGKRGITYETLMHIKEGFHIPNSHFTFLLTGEEERAMEPMILRENYQDAETTEILEFIESDSALKSFLLQLIRIPDKKRKSFIKSLLYMVKQIFP